jgi:antitoxin component YwqK of YwqJK toxin-antitoxin module
MKHSIQYLILILSLFLLINGVEAQQSINIDYQTREMIVNKGDTITRVRILVENPTIKANQERLYAWYQKQVILETRGSWAGKLLHGRYETFYPNHNLLEQGEYRNGYKVGEWSKWYPNGEIAERINWKNGLADGCFERYDNNGDLVEQGKYKQGEIHGLVISYKDGKRTKSRYRNGIVKQKSLLKKKLKKSKDTNKENISKKE